MFFLLVADRHRMASILAVKQDEVSFALVANHESYIVQHAEGEVYCGVLYLEYML